MKMLKVKFKKNGYKTVMNEKLADIYEKKGKIEILKEEKVKDEPAKEAKK